jgi:SAM-dependent methyltransferase
MPTIDENRRAWGTYDWSRAGDEWSISWGSPAAQWYGTILPRLYPWLPTGTLLEIAPGFGRWTHFMKDLAARLVLVDVTERCISACRARFASAPNITYHVNDGRSLEMIPDGTIDLAFSFDSLVHVEADVIEGYLTELARTLSPDGVGFIHHSNIGVYSRRIGLGRRVSHLAWPLSCLNTPLEWAGITAPNSGWRAESLTASRFEDLCDRTGLQCRSQEIIDWGGRVLSDCFSVFTRPGSRWARKNCILVNPRFMSEARYIAARHQMYGT